MTPLLTETAFKLICSQVSDCVFATDAEGRITFMSEGAQLVFGRSPASMVGTQGMAHFSQESKPEVERAFGELLASERTQLSLEVRPLRQDGSQFLGTLRACALQGGVLSVITDLSGKHAIQARLTRQNRDLSLLHQFTLEVVAQASRENLHRIIAGGLRQFAGAFLVSISDYDAPGRPTTSTICSASSSDMRRSLWSSCPETAPL